MTTWNPSDKSANITLSNGDLTATATTTAWKSVRNTNYVTSGKWYWEITLGSGLASTYNILGVGTNAASVGNYCGADAYGWGYHGSDGKKFHNGSSVAYGSTFSSSDIIGVALDADNGKIWFSKNGVWQASGDPSNGTNAAYTGLSGNLFPMVSPYTSGNSSTANFGASSFSYSVPSGFSAYDLSQPILISAVPGILTLSASGNVITTSADTEVACTPGVLTFSASAAIDNVSGHIKAIPGVITFESFGQPGVGPFAQTGVLTLGSSGQPAVGPVAQTGVLTLGSSGQPAVAVTSPIGVLAFTGSCGGTSFVNLVGTTKYYLLVLTGVEDGLADVTIPISSFQLRKRSGDPTFLQVVAPSLNSIGDIEARRNGQLKLKVAFKSSNGSFINAQNLVVVDFDSFDYADGPKSKSITLQGTKTVTYANKTVAIDKVVTFFGGANTRANIKTPEIDINPGDTIIYNEHTFVANIITYFLSLTANGIPTFYGTISESE